MRKTLREIITATRHQEDKNESNKPSLPHQDAAKLEMTQNDAKQSQEQTQNPTMEQQLAKNRTAALERTTA